MGRKDVKRPVYDGNACLLYDYMITQGLTEEKVAKLIVMDSVQKGIRGINVPTNAPWQPVARWIQHPSSIPRCHIYQLCRILKAPFEAVYIQSKILNGKEFTAPNEIGRQDRKCSDDFRSEDLIKVLTSRGFKVSSPADFHSEDLIKALTERGYKVSRED